MKRLVTLLLIWMPLLALAQSSNISTLFTSNFKKAEILYNQFAYRNALTLYLYTTEKDTSNHVARQRVADCYFRLGNIPESEKWYAELARLKDADPKYKYQYAQILSIQGKYAESKKWYGAYLAAVKDSRANEKLEFIDHLDYYLRDSALYEIAREPYNSDQSDFAPQYFEGGIVFVSARDRELFIKQQSLSALNDDEAMLNVFFAPNGATTDKEVSLFDHRDLNSAYHDGPVAFYQGGKQIVFSRSNLKSGKPIPSSGRVNLELYFAETQGHAKLGRLESFPFNDDAYSVGHPWISEDGNTLYFASDMPGGQGGTDLYKSEKKNGKWGTPKNLGPVINTLGDEFYPFLSNDTTLYFSSDGHGGLGGQDVYVSRIQGADFLTPKNLGFPLNTSHDDFSLVIDPSGRSGMFASNRPDGAGYDDVYRFKVRSFFVEGRVVKRNDSTQVIPDALVLLKNASGLVIDSISSDSRGAFHFDLEFDKDYSLAARKKGYSWIDSLKYTTRSRVLGHDTLLIALLEHALVAKGIIYSNESQSPLQNATVVLQNLTDGVADSIITDLTGAYSFMVEPGKKYNIRAHEPRFIPQEIRLNTKGLYRGNLLNDIVLEEEFLDKVVIQFNFDDDRLRDSELPKFEKLKKHLKRRPNLTLLISAFADSHGTREYNQGLSDRRAGTVLKHFAAFGIDVKRITAVGFGETLLLNRCSDGVECNEEEHSQNRRAELKVQQTDSAIR